MLRSYKDDYQSIDKQPTARIFVHSSLGHRDYRKPTIVVNPVWIANCAGHGCLDGYDLHVGPQPLQIKLPPLPRHLWGGREIDNIYRMAVSYFPGICRRSEV